ncbi:hypothetical protein INT48_003113 [Thamnidium elegans]|uniref:RlpA-like protein double-psi beta-barrel domain-containing protein n=1 Tax=Thamnidium elegans TaxID=101142 RepID=A0A8H7VW93_9FUNG|nr:hypothetical protein INT48_003113 [Thamnidium elegans]
MKFSIIGLAVATVCMLGMTVADDSNVVNDVVYNRNMPKTTAVMNFGMSGFLKKRKESRPFDTNKRKRSAATINRHGMRRAVEKRNKKNKRGSYANSGTATFFTPNRGSCGWKNSPNDLIVAMNGKDMKNQSGKSNKNPLCGKMVEITNSSGTKIRAKIVDTCPGCSKGDLDLSPAVFSKLAPLKKGVLKIQWKYV